MRGVESTLLLFAGPPQGSANTEAHGHVRRLAAELSRPDLKVLVISAPEAGGYADPDGRAHAAYGAEAAAAVLVRPDGYVGVRCDPLDERELRQALDRLFTRRAEAA